MTLDILSTKFDILTQLVIDGFKRTDERFTSLEAIVVNLEGKVDQNHRSSGALYEHLDDKIQVVVEYVTGLSEKVDTIENQIDTMQQDIMSTKQSVQLMQQDITCMRNDINVTQQDVNLIKIELYNKVDRA